MENEKFVRTDPKSQEMIEEMKQTVVWVKSGKTHLWPLCQNLVERIKYFNMVNRPTKDHPEIDYVQKIVHDLGFRFSDGTEIRHVKASHFNYFAGVDIVERRERL